MSKLVVLNYIVNVFQKGNYVILIVFVFVVIIQLGNKSRLPKQKVWLIIDNLDIFLVFLNIYQQENVPAKNLYAEKNIANAIIMD